MILGTQIKVYVPHFLGKNAKRDPHKLFREDFWGRKQGPKRAIFYHKKFSLLFLPLKMKVPAVRPVASIACLCARFYTGTLNQRTSFSSQVRRQYCMSCIASSVKQDCRVGWGPSTRRCGASLESLFSLGQQKSGYPFGFAPSPRKRAQNEEKLYKSVENPQTDTFSQGRGNAISWTKQFYGHLGVSDWVFKGGTWDVPRFLSGCPAPWGGGFKNCAKKVCAHLSPPSQSGLVKGVFWKEPIF